MHVSDPRSTSSSIAVAEARACSACSQPPVRGGPQRTRRRGHGAAALRAVLLGATDPNKAIDFALVLRLPGQARLTRFLNEVDDPARPTIATSSTPTPSVNASVSHAPFSTSATTQLALDGIRSPQLPPAHRTRRSRHRRNDRPVFDFRLMD